MLRFFTIPGDFGMWPALLLLLTIIFFIPWVLVWKGLALWHAARRGERWWFVALLVVNTLGILEIIYLFVVAKIKIREVFYKTTKKE